MGTGCSNYPLVGDLTVTALKKPDARQYVSRAIYSGTRPISAGQVAKRIAAIKAAALKSQAKSSDDAAPVAKRAMELAGQ
jgi:hypothetical protein